ncbi:uncharacterized protein PADG_07572 [Paracoccidioides brasiliensis Pb18]|uniref:Uncharacterized protein n=1 Tax=Paracoccidioides brasiliensis (strain Pb18) TaxID=502780 RepID=C1GJY6_PARBD|nr:uncharacterized protein PADG_07572 [Paracoccidioides brasiliensis Pb18]EEH42752.2 hypothetical protein PADG_07572 [Paracoccidioides brasiliensis Pb18]
MEQFRGNRPAMWAAQDQGGSHGRPVQPSYGQPLCQAPYPMPAYQEHPQPQAPYLVQHPGGPSVTSQYQVTHQGGPPPSAPHWVPYHGAPHAPAPYQIQYQVHPPAAAPYQGSYHEQQRAPAPYHVPHHEQPQSLARHQMLGLGQSQFNVPHHMEYDGQPQVQAQHHIEQHGRSQTQAQHHVPHYGQHQAQVGYHTPHHGQPQAQVGYHTPHHGQPQAQVGYHTPHHGQPQAQNQYHAPYHGPTGAQARPHGHLQENRQAQDRAQQQPMPRKKAIPRRQSMQTRAQALHQGQLIENDEVQGEAKQQATKQATPQKLVPKAQPTARATARPQIQYKPKHQAQFQAQQRAMHQQRSMDQRQAMNQQQAMTQQLAQLSSPVSPETLQRRKLPHPREPVLPGLGLFPPAPIVLPAHGRQMVTGLLPQPQQHTQEETLRGRCGSALTSAIAPASASAPSLAPKQEQEPEPAVPSEQDRRPSKDLQEMGNPEPNAKELLDIQDVKRVGYALLPPSPPHHLPPLGQYACINRAATQQENELPRGIGNKRKAPKGHLGNYSHSGVSISQSSDQGLSRYNTEETTLPRKKPRLQEDSDLIETAITDPGPELALQGPENVRSQSDGTVALAINDGMKDTRSQSLHVEAPSARYDTAHAGPPMPKSDARASSGYIHGPIESKSNAQSSAEATVTSEKTYKDPLPMLLDAAELILGPLIPKGMFSNSQKAGKEKLTPKQKELVPLHKLSCFPNPRRHARLALKLKAKTAAKARGDSKQSYLPSLTGTCHGTEILQFPPWPGVLRYINPQPLDNLFPGTSGESRSYCRRVGERTQPNMPLSSLSRSAICANRQLERGTRIGAHQYENSFNIFQEFLKRPDMVLVLAHHMRVQELLILYRISRDFHNIINSRFRTVIQAQATLRAPQSAEIFPPRCYAKLCNPDPGLRPHPVASRAAWGEVRKVPSFRWLLMVCYREMVCHQIITILAEDGVPVPDRCESVIKKIWFLMDIPDNARRIALVQNREIFTNADIFFAVLFFVKLDMRFTDPVTGSGKDGMRRMLLSQPSLTLLWRTLKRTALVSKLQVMKTFARWKYEPPPIFRGMSVFGVPADQVGTLQYQAWGRTANRVRLQRPDELLLKESVRRQMSLHRNYSDLFFWGYLNPRTMQNYPPVTRDRELKAFDGLEEMLVPVEERSKDDTGKMVSNVVKG